MLLDKDKNKRFYAYHFDLLALFHKPLTNCGHFGPLAKVRHTHSHDLACKPLKTLVLLFSYHWDLISNDRYELLGLGRKHLVHHCCCFRFLELLRES